MKKVIYTTILATAMVGMLSGCGNTDGSNNTVASSESTSTTENNTGTELEATVATDEASVDDASDDRTADASATDETYSGDAVTEGKTAQEIADAILNGGEYSEVLQPLTEQVALNRLYELDAEQIEESAFYTNSQATAEEIAVIKVKSEDYVQEVKDSFNARVEDQKEACEDYLPDEMPKLEKAVVYDNGCYVILSVSVDSSKVEEVIAGLF